MRAAILSLVVTAGLLGTAPAFAQATGSICKDGTSSAATGRGACSDHGGVDKSATSQAKKVVKAEQKAELRSAKATGTAVTCTDGSTSNPGRGACSHHGGIRVAGTAAGTIAPVRAPVREAYPTRAPVRAAPMAAAAASHRSEDNDPNGAIAQCRDGMYSHAANRQGACSRHQGVAKWMP
jgi:hypothetical protein